MIVEVFRRSLRCLPKSAWVAQPCACSTSMGTRGVGARKHASPCERASTAGCGRRASSQNVTHLLVHGFGVLAPEILLVTFTFVPDGMKFTLPGPSVMLVYDAVTFAAEIPSMITLSSVMLFMCDESYPSSVTRGVFEPPPSSWKF